VRNRVYEGERRSALAYVALLEGAHAEAEREARAASELLEPFGGAVRAAPLPILSLALLASGRHAEALAAAREANALAGWVLLDGTLLLALAESLAMSGADARDEARGVARAARDRLLGFAARIESPVERERFLAIFEHARTLALPV
jgi:hypothetical protein